MQPVVHASTRTLGSSSVLLAVHAWRKPMSPLSRALCPYVSGTPFDRLTRFPYGLFATSGAGFAAEGLHTAFFVEAAVDDVHLLLLREAHEIHGVARHADREARILLRVLHGVEQRLLVQHVDVHVIAGHREERVE